MEVSLSTFVQLDRFSKFINGYNVDKYGSMRTTRLTHENLPFHIYFVLLTNFAYTVHTHTHTHARPMPKRDRELNT